MLLSGKTAIISGAAGARGIGFATAKLFAAHGGRVAILDIDAAGAARAASELGAGHIGLACDVTNKPDCERAVAEVHATGGPVGAPGEPGPVAAQDALDAGPAAEAAPDDAAPAIQAEPSRPEVR